jgi:hypothetical protein
VKKGKHIIFLGAGASKQSGYPLANDLRLLISSRKKWEEALVEYEDKHKLSNRSVSTLGVNYWDNHVDALNLFRKGGFATIDEFCKLAGGFSFQNEINNLRCLLRAALGLFNPEENFEKIVGMSRSDGDITLVKDFSEFIKTQMKPVVLS